MRAIGAQILVPEAAGDLVVALETADHEQLLVDLRRLRQREEAALLEPRGDEEVACAFGRRLEARIGVSMSRKPAASISRRMIETASGSQADVSLQPVPTEVEPAIADAQRLVDVLLVELERERRARRDDLELVDLELDLAGRQVRVDVLRRASGDLADSR